MQIRQTYAMGFAPLNAAAGGTELILNNSPDLFGNPACFALAFSFVPTENATVSSVSWCFAFCLGTCGPTRVQLASDDGSGLPGANLGAYVEIPSPAPSTGGQPVATGFSVAVTAGVQYWVILSLPTANGTAGPMVRFGKTNTGPIPWGGNARCGWNVAAQVTGASPSLWTSQAVGSCGWRIGYNGDTAYDGTPVVAIGASLAVSGTAEEGVKFTVPPHASWNIRGVWFHLPTVSSPAAGVRAKLYTGSALPASLSSNVAISPVLPVASVTGGGWFRFDFSATVPCAAGTVCRITFGEATNSDTGAKYQTTAVYWSAQNSESLALLPFGGTARRTQYDGTTWTDDTSDPNQTSVVPFLVLLDTSDPFTVPPPTTVVGVFGVTT